MERRKAMRFRNTIASPAMPEATQDQGAPRGAPCPSCFDRGAIETATRAWRENECACVNERGCLKIESEVEVTHTVASHSIVVPAKAVTHIP
jgi:hypothetical protein